MKITDPIEGLKGIGPKKKSYFHQLNIFTIEDLIHYYPFRYEDASRFVKIKEAIRGEKTSLHIQIDHIHPSQRLNAKRSMQRVDISDETGQAHMTFFNQPFLVKKLREGRKYVIYGKIDYYSGQVSISNPQIEPEARSGDIGKIIPVYSATEGLSSKEIRKILHHALREVLPLTEILPEYLIRRYNLLDRSEAIRQIHEPQSMDAYAKAYQRLAFEEFLLFQLSLMSNKALTVGPGISFKPRGNVDKLLNSLGFSLTEGQARVWQEILSDMRSDRPMARLIQGDVGSGKTVLAVMASVLAIENGKQVLMMAPTEILAKQHFESFRELMEPLGMKFELLVGSMTPKEKKRVKELARLGMCDVVIGTHALIEDDLVMPHLGLTITDEQHRFGVKQREKLQKKIYNGDHLVMSATPIPRTLGLVLYGDMDVSIIDTMPPGRKPVITTAIHEEQLNSAYEFMREQLKAGHQLYVICPLIEENEKLDLEAAEEVYENLKQNIFPDYQVELLHGRMKESEKTEIMNRFHDNQTQMLVSTTVIEVGVNVPNANCLFVYNAERFGLSQLHQLRGRVGRGATQAYCILFSKQTSDIAWKRMKIMESSSDGFYIAEKDLELRGFGDLLGTRQSGLAQFRIGNPLTDQNIMYYAQQEAKAIVEGNHLNEIELPELTIFMRHYMDRMNGRS